MAAKNGKVGPVAAKAAALQAKVAARARQPLKPKHVPQRTCVACRSTSAKREFVRLVRTPDGRVEVDPTGKKAGRGAYLCNQPGCWDQALTKNRLSLALKTTVSAEDNAVLRAYAAALESH
jgi:predicted RNA-binding protein YlxR (DUF448 family)